MEIIERICKWRDQELLTHWRELTAGQHNALLKGQSARRELDGSAVIEIDFALTDERKADLVQMTCCNPDGTAIYASTAAVFAEPAGKANALKRLAEEARAYFEGDEGNG